MEPLITGLREWVLAVSKEGTCSRMRQSQKGHCRKAVRAHDGSTFVLVHFSCDGVYKICGRATFFIITDSARE
jgi:hypothetical protein